MSEGAERRFQGQPVSAGIAMGKLRVEARGCAAPPTRTILPTEIEAEWQRFETALERTELEIKLLKTRVEELSGANEAAIFDAHLLFLRDRMIIARMRKEMPRRLQNIDSVYYAVVQNFMEAMRQVDDAYLRSRVADIADVLQRVLKNLDQGAARTRRNKTVSEEPCLLAAYDLTPSDTADLDSQNVLGFVTEAGSSISHTAILARSLGLPAVVAVPNLVREARVGTPAILDGYHGTLILNPTAETRAHYEQMRAEKEKAYQALLDMRDLPAETRDAATSAWPATWSSCMSTAPSSAMGLRAWACTAPNSSCWGAMACPMRRPSTSTTAAWWRSVPRRR